MSEEKPEPIALGFTHDANGVLLYVQRISDGEIEFQIKIQPDDARDAAFKLSYNAIKCEELRKNIGGGGQTEGP